MAIKNEAIQWEICLCHSFKSPYFFIKLMIEVFYLDIITLETFYIDACTKLFDISECY